jgi:hypothetical protein
MQFFLDWQSDGILARVALVLYGVVLLALVLPRLRRCGALTRLLPAAMLWHLFIWAFIAFWMLPYYMATTGADCYGYHHEGIRIAGLIRAGDWGSISWGVNTAAMPIITGFLYTPFGGDIYGVLFFSSVLGFCAGLYLCLAFSLWATQAQLKTYSLIVLFLPSFATWTGFFGKDSWIALGLGLAAYGYSSMLKARRSTGLWYLLVGVAIVTVVRPHIAVALAASMALAYVWVLTRARHVSILAKFGTVVMLIVMFALLASVARGFLGLSDVSANSMEEFAQTKGQGNAIGGSAVEIQAAPGVAGALLAFPRGIVRELFQPFPWEVHNVNAGMAAGENLFILWFALGHAKRLRGLLRGITREPYVLFSSVLACSLLLMFSFTPNLGLLSRQRAQFLPFVFVPLVAAAAVRRRASQLAPMTAPVGWRYSPGRALAGTRTAFSSTPANRRIPPSPLPTRGPAS